ncbi:hypothetical protein tinsulaeT_17040 [Thalassotalea insulae]|uniref:Esterase n=1 Tax=Thalassotalea insulae TaxID=2056778 RepID=A0ABQ6GSR1_9GAMM|nr:alpha/beta fold hydrolase [Thalassotalea insulae]GLX78364.1 hypothetical protein tinsulaeT_17040 [Thalassotalea insulae]
MPQIITLILTLLFSSLTWSKSVTIKHQFHSAALNETRPVLVHLPKNYAEQSDKSYPVLVTLNDQDNFHWASTIVDIQAARYGIDQMIVVGLPHTGNYSDDNFPFIDEENSMVLSPQAQKYSAFIREEAMAFVTKNYRTNGGRFIIGHSLSGLLVTQMFTQYPQSFSAFIALSPSMHYAPQLTQLVSQFLNTHPQLSSQFYLAIGDIEHSLIQQDYAKLAQVFKNSAPSGLTWTASTLANTDHMLSAFKGIYDSLAWLYQDWSIRDTQAQTMTATDIINHYQQLSQRLHYPIKPREKNMRGLSWFLAEKLAQPNAAQQVLQASLHFYPDSTAIQHALKELKLSNTK